MTNAILQRAGTPIIWKDSGGDYAITASSLGALAGRVGARGDLGVWPRATTYRWYLETAWVANPVANETLDFYLSLWDNDTGPANPWAQVGATDSALAASTVRSNLLLVGSVTVEAATANLYSAGGVIVIPARYISPVLFNGSNGKALAAVGTTPTVLRLTPIYDEIQ
jgi:hypothetical protein